VLLGEAEFRTTAVPLNGKILGNKWGTPALNILIIEIDTAILAPYYIQ